MNTVTHASVTIQTSPEPVHAVPPWFGEVAVITHFLARQGILTTLSDRVRFARKRFGIFEVIDFVTVLIGMPLVENRRSSTITSVYVRSLFRSRPCSDAASCLIVPP